MDAVTAQLSRNMEFPLGLQGHLKEPRDLLQIIRKDLRSNIIDLSSGEELVALHLGSNDHKRMRDYDPTSPTGSMDSLREVFEYQEDGNLLPIREYISTQPSPAKKVRLGRSSHHSTLRFLSEGESDSETRGHDPKPRQSQSQRAAGNNGFYRKTKQKRKYWSLDTTRRNDKTSIRGGSGNVFTGRPFDGVDTDGTVEGDTEVEGSIRSCNVEEANTGDTTKVDNQSNGFSIEERNQELIPYQHPTARSPSNELIIDWKLWKHIGHTNTIPLTELKGNEVVLYKNNSSLGLESSNDGNYNGQEYEVYCEMDGNYQSCVVIEELADDYGGNDDNGDDDDDDGNMADDEACELSDDGPLIELEERIMDMDLD
ncbi:hypothetical protein BGX20_002193 [Mortierella sp. AD010]|nr:hypothetical protein BGX20_002193 [Mortierella sp. AD010]